MGALRDCLAWLGMDFEADEPDNVESDHESESQVTAPLQSTIPDPAAVSPGRASGALDSEAESSSRRGSPRTLLDEIMVSRDQPNAQMLQFSFPSRQPCVVSATCAQYLGNAERPTACDLGSCLSLRTAPRQGDCGDFIDMLATLC